MEKLKLLLRKHKQLLLYLAFGMVTSVASLLACFLTLKIGVRFIHDEHGNPTELLDVLGSSVQWVVGVLVAFVTNKKWVFTNAAHGARSTAKQLGKFAGGRVITYFVEVVVNLGSIALLDNIGYNAITFMGISFSSRVWAKIISSFIVVIANYFISKLVVFKNNKEKTEFEENGLR